MRNFILFVGLAAAGLVSCDSLSKEDLPDGKATLCLDLTAETSYKNEGVSKAVDTDTYQNVENYWVKILRGEEVVKSYERLADMPVSETLPVATYTLVASMGDADKAVGIDNMYVEGSTSVTLEKDGSKEVSINCVPANVKIRMDYSGDMDTYYSDYSVTFSTRHMNGTPFTLPRDQKDADLFLKAVKDEPLTVKVNLTKRSDNSSASIEKNYTISPRDFLTIHVKPVVITSTGSLGISITVNTTTNDQDVPVDVPSDWIEAEPGN